MNIKNLVPAAIAASLIQSFGRCMWFQTMKELNLKTKLALILIITAGVFIYFWLKEQNIVFALLPAILTFLIMLFVSKINSIKH